MLSVKK
jgi:hypothetical protein